LTQQSVLIWVLLFLVIVAVVHAEEKITIYTEEWAPYNFKNNEKIVGISTEIVEATFIKANVNYELIMAAWARGYRTVSDKKNTMLFTTARTKERESLFQWVGPIANRNIHLLKLKKREDILMSSLADVKNYRLGLLRDDASTQYFVEMGLLDNTKHYIIPKAESEVKMLYAERIDLIPGNETAAKYQAKIYGYPPSEIEKSFLLFDDGGYYMAFNKDTDPELVNKINHAFIDLSYEGAFQRIKEKYLK
jgi:polar amino acid transport system substrate-binding protein